eukprot:SAG31_NODE_14289_length_816_cov_1.126918_2_plen_126_part_00
MARKQQGLIRLPTSPPVPALPAELAVPDDTEESAARLSTAEPPANVYANQDGEVGQSSKAEEMDPEHVEILGQFDDADVDEANESGDEEEDDDDDDNEGEVHESDHNVQKSRTKAKRRYEPNKAC